MNNYKVTILLATFNRSHLIEQTLNSIKSQTYKNWDCIIVDDHSTDDTSKVVSSIIAEDSRFSYFLKTEAYKKGLSGTRNYGLELARTRNAKYIQFFDDDDIMHPEKLELQMRPFYENLSLHLTICQYRKFIDENTIEFDLDKAEDFVRDMKSTNILESFFLYLIDLNSLGPIWKSDIILKYRFDENLEYGEERELYLRIFLLEQINYISVPLVLFWYRKHENSITHLYHSENSKAINHNEIIEDLFLDLVVKKKYTSYPILKAYTVWGIKRKNKTYLSKIVSLLNNESSPKYKLKYFKLYILAKCYLITK